MDGGPFVQSYGQSNPLSSMCVLVQQFQRTSEVPKAPYPASAGAIASPLRHCDSRRRLQRSLLHRLNFAWRGIVVYCTTNCQVTLKFVDEEESMAKKKRNKTPNVPRTAPPASNTAQTAKAQAAPAKRMSQRERKRRQSQIMLIVGSIVAIAAVALIVFVSSSAQSAGAPPVTSDLPTELVDRAAKGSAGAAVVLQEFADFECPACKTFSEGTAKRLEEEYVKTGKVRFEFKHYPLPQHEPGATRAANAAECAADQGKFWEMHDYLFQEQGLQGPNTFTASRLRSMGEALGLDMDEFNSCISRETHRQRILDDVNEARGLLVNATPTIFVNGKRIDSPSYEAVKAAIEAAIAGQG